MPGETRNYFIPLVKEKLIDYYDRDMYKSTKKNNVFYTRKLKAEVP